jgi:hypothetical protein
VIAVQPFLEVLPANPAKSPYANRGNLTARQQEVDLRATELEQSNEIDRTQQDRFSNAVLGRNQRLASMNGGLAFDPTGSGRLDCEVLNRAGGFRVRQGLASPLSYYMEIQ